MENSSKSCLPNNFIPARDPRYVKLHFGPPSFINDSQPKGVRAAGIRYEHRGQAYLLRDHPDTYLPSIWFSFWEGDQRWCQPDGLIVNLEAGKITVIEFKLKHTPKAWWQVTDLYLPVVKKFFGDGWSYAGCEVCKWFDPAVAFPGPYVRTRDVDSLESGSFGVHIWSGR